MNLIWGDNKIQFPRLLAEIRAIGLTNTQYKELAESMDISQLDVDELLERAESEWEEIKRQSRRWMK